MNAEHIFEVRDLVTEFTVHGRTTHAVNNVSFHINEGEVISIVGESGSGKSVTQMSTLQLIPTPPGKILSGEVLFEGTDLRKFPANGKELRSIRGKKISMIFQEPMTSLNPVLKIGEQIDESVRLHLGLNKSEARQKTLELLKLVNIPDAEQRYDAYPHQFSGGMRQRIMIAMALSCSPRVLIADEATTALDVTTQAQLLEMLKDIVKKTGTALIIVTHNLGIVARYADRIYVMYAGRIVESGDTDDIFKNPSHAYTAGLLNSVPRLDDSKDRELVPIEGRTPDLTMLKEQCSFLPRCGQKCEICSTAGIPPLRNVSGNHFTACYNEHISTAQISKKLSSVKQIVDEDVLEVKGLKLYYPIQKGIINKKTINNVKAVDGIDFKIRRGETVGLVGESGCGKSTVARALLRLEDITQGDIFFEGHNLASMKQAEIRTLRKRIQLIFQDPFSSLDPRQTIGNIVGEPLIVNKLVKTKYDYMKRVEQLFEQVGLNRELMKRAPHELSGGQRQRIGIARALACEPSLIICDEAVSALDVSIQAQVVNLLESLQAELGISYLFIAHDLSVVRHISDRIAVMYLGKIVEMSDWKTLYENPKHPYTKALLSAIPIPDPDIERERERIILPGEVPSNTDLPPGCSFNPRCLYASETCRESAPVLSERGAGHLVSCFNV